MSKKKSDLRYSGVTSIIRAQVSAGLFSKGLRSAYSSFIKFPMILLCCLFIPITELSFTSESCVCARNLPTPIFTNTQNSLDRI